MEPGTQLGPYEVKEPLGKGGMGEVYRAHDAKLRRDVAIKLLPEEVAHDPRRLDRLTREARSLASLNHAHIATVYGFEEQDGTSFIVMELVEGETLADRLRQGALPIDEALEYGLQIARALEAAHGRGIVHRDLKPANVKITPAGETKVLDLGLAKPLNVEVEADRSGSQQPTATAEATRNGAVMGTAPYMSPEQARGDEVDARTDIWAFGCLLYEMLTAARAFGAQSASDAVAAVLTREPDWDALPRATPWRVRELLRRSLRKSARQRLHHIADVRIELEEALDDPEVVPRGTISAAEDRGSWAPWAAAVALLGVAAALAWALAPRADPGAKPGGRTAFEIAVPNLVWNATETTIAVSPNGDTVAYMAETAPDRPPVLWLRTLDEVEPRPVPGTEGAGNLFWSPDGRRIGYVQDDVIRVVDREGGPEQEVARLDSGTFGPPVWMPDGSILFSGGRLAEGLRIMRVPGDGGEPVEVSAPTGELGHVFPSMLPDGESFLYLGIQPRAVQRNVLYMRSLDGGEPVRIEGVHSRAEYAAGHLFYWDQGALVARRFDPEDGTFTDDPVSVGEMGGAYFARTGMADFSIARSGATLAYGSRDRSKDLRWFDASGRDLGTLDEPRLHDDYRISPVGDRVAMDIEDRSTGTGDISIFDVRRGVASRRFGGAGDDTDPAWSPDGERIAYSSDTEGRPRIFIRPADGSGEPRLVATKETQPLYVEDWSSDGEHIAYVAWTQNPDLYVVPVDGTASSRLLAGGPGHQEDARFSPDTRWVAFSSEEAGNMETFVVPFPGGEVPQRVSSGGGRYPVWHPDGRELYYVDQALLYAVDFTPESGTIGRTRELFSLEASRSILGVDVGPDGERFLLAVGDRHGSGASVTVALNWLAERD